jgi:hypothetical protein
MSVILWLVSLFLLWWAFLIVAYRAVKWADRHPRLARLTGLLAAAMAVLIVVWVFNEPARIPIAEFMVAAVAITFVLAVFVALLDKRKPAPSRSSSGSSEAVSYGSSQALSPVSSVPSGSSPALPESTSSGHRYRCTTCGVITLPAWDVVSQQLQMVQAGLADSARAIENQEGYRCQGCEKVYCKGCLERTAPLKPGGGRLCPACGGSFGRVPD